MRIATSTIYNDQTTSIDALSAQYQSIGADLSTGKSLNVPSDDPSQVSQDLTLTTTIAAENGDASNAAAATNELTFTDNTLSSLTSLLQSARSLAVEGATDIIPNGTQRPLIGKQIGGLLNQALQLANQQYGTTYIFAGTGSSTTPPITAQGNPPTGVIFTGNNQARTELINGQQVQVGTTMQAAFNQGSTNGTPSVFTLLATLRDTMDQEPASIESQQPINVTGDTIQGAGDAVPTTLGTIAGPPAMTTIPLTTDNAVPPSYSIEIDGTNPATAAPGKAVLTFGANTPVDNGTPNSVVGAINAQTATTGVTAAWNVASQRLVLTSVAPNSPPFLVSNVPSPLGAAIIAPGPPTVVATAATTTSNFLQAFQIPDQVSVTSNLSTQIGNIDAVINQVLSARAQVGQQIQNLAGTSTQVQALANDNTTTQSGIADTNIAQATSQFTLVQTALQAAYATTTRLEGKTLIDYL
ncbi:MAG: flagellar hook-associated protein FlgL [Candidatus Lustribacter sp.]|jgi:flagellar hook-associated protein 3 FlgL